MIDEEKKRWSSEVIFLVIMLGLVAMFGIIMGLRYLRQPEILTPDELHQRNLEGKLDENQGYVYNGFSFVWYENMWFTQLHPAGSENVYNIQLHYGPRETKNISVRGDPMPFTRAQALYVTFDPIGQDLQYVALAAGEFSLGTAVVLNITPIAACTRNETAICSKRPIVSCETDNEHAIVQFTTAEMPGITVQGNCINISGAGKDIVRAIDKLLLLWFKMVYLSTE